MAWSAERIKRVHDPHTHYARMEQQTRKQPTVYPPCPACPLCKCPVHRADHHAVVPNEVTANAFTEQ